MTLAYGAPGGVLLARVVAVVVGLKDGREQIGSGFMLGGGRVLTAEHCVRDKLTGQPGTTLTVVSSAAGTSAGAVVAARAVGVDLAVLMVDQAPWKQTWPSLVFGRVHRDSAGMLTDCQAIGFPLFQYDPGPRSRHTAELHGTIYQTDEFESGRLLMREQLLTTVTAANPIHGAPDSGWGGLSGAVVFYRDLAIGVVVEHHPRQGAAAVQLSAFDHLLELAVAGSAESAAVAAELGVTQPSDLRWVSAAPVTPLTGLVEILDGLDLPVASTLDPYRMGASTTDFGDHRSHGQHDPYVARTAADVDARLAAALSPGELTVLVGPSKVGKSRTGFEAIISRWPEARVVTPAPGVSWSLLAQHPRLASTSDPLLVWLDDIDRYLSGPDPLTVAVLTALRFRPGLTILLGTLRSETRELLGRAEGEPGRSVRAVLDAAVTIELASTTADPTEQANAAQAYPNRPADIGLAEWLAQAPALLRRYHDLAAADPVTYQAVRIVVDWARLGLSRPLGEPQLMSFLTDAMWNERPDLDVDGPYLDNAIGLARRSLTGHQQAALLLTHPLPEKVRGYRPFDYLVAADDGQGSAGRPIPDDFWSQVLTSRVDSDDAFHIGYAAYNRGQFVHAAAAFRIGAEAGDTRAMNNLGAVLAERLAVPDIDGAQLWYRKAADSGDTGAMFNLGLLLSTRRSPPDLGGARHWYEKAAAAGHSEAMFNLGGLASSQDPPDLVAARRWWTLAAEAGHVGAMNNLGAMLAGNDDLPTAERWWQRSAAAGDISAMINLGQLAQDREPPDLPAARTWLDKACQQGSVDAMFRLAVLLATKMDPPDLVGAQQYWERAADAGDSGAMFNLGLLCQDRVPPDGQATRQWWQQAAALGHVQATFNLGALLAADRAGQDLPAARHWLTLAATMGNYRAMGRLGDLLAEQWKPAEPAAARDWWEQAAAGGESGAMFRLGRLAAEAAPPDPDAARRWFEKAATAGHPEAMVQLGHLLDMQSPPDPAAARTWWMKAAENGHPAAMNILGALALAARPPELADAHQWFAAAATRENTDAMYNLGVLLSSMLDPPDPTGARRWFEQAATAGHLEAMNNLGGLLAISDPPDFAGARPWYAKAAAAGHLEATFNLGLLSSKQDPPDLYEARRWWEKAATAGHVEAMNSLGALLSSMLDPPDLTAARHWFESAAAAGHIEAMYNLGELCADLLQPADTPTARHWWQRAADAGNIMALNRISQLDGN